MVGLGRAQAIESKATWYDRDVAAAEISNTAARLCARPEASR